MAVAMHTKLTTTANAAHTVDTIVANTRQNQLTMVVTIWHAHEHGHQVQQLLEVVEAHDMQDCAVVVTQETQVCSACHAHCRHSVIILTVHDTHSVSAMVPYSAHRVYDNV
jgi:recombinational DNA repair protein RecR